jgi:nucleoid-associated protein YgaU
MVRVCRGVLVLIFLVLAASGAIVHAVEYGGLGGLPANPDPDNPRTKSIFVYTLSPGQSKQDAVQVINNTDEEKTVEVYATDSEIASGGAFACRQKVDPKTAVGGWIRLDQTEVKLAPNTSQVVPFNVFIPETAGVGEHNGCIVIQEREATPEQTGNGVQLSFRSALRVAITVPGDIIKDVDFTELSVSQEAKKYVLSAKLHNKGNVSLDTEIKVYVKNWSNRLVYENGGVYPLLAQKQPIELNFDFPRPFWGGLYRISGTAAYNGDKTAALGSTDDRNVFKQAPGRLLFVPPEPLAIAIIAAAFILLILAVGLVAGRMRKNRRRAAGVAWKVYSVRSGDTLPHLARRLNADWKTIAKKNKLRAPYELKEGMTIRLPVKRKSE